MKWWEDDARIMATKRRPERTSREIWSGVFAFANRFAADLVKYFVVLLGLVLVSFALREVKLAGLLAEDYVDILEKIDFAANLAIILVLAIDFVTRLYRSYRESE